MIKSKPKVFISYSWSSEQFKETVRIWADRLLKNGIGVVLDQYDLKPGDDMYAFMEQMVLDSSVTHVMIVCDKKYSSKANARNSGVGTESQIISSELYKKVKQNKFIPIFVEFDESGEPCIPVYLNSRLGIDFSSIEMVNRNWDELIRLLYNKPKLEKPALGEPPEHISDESNSTLNLGVLKSRYVTLEQSIISESGQISFHRTKFLESCIETSDELRVRESPDTSSLGRRILTDCNRLKNVRNLIVDWLLLETSGEVTNDFVEDLINFLEKLIEQKEAPSILDSWQPHWFEAHVIFLYETFLYIVATLLKTRRYRLLHEIFFNDYLLPEIKRTSSDSFTKFTSFYGSTEFLGKEISPPGKKFTSPIAEMVHRQADRTDINFNSLIEAEMLIYLMSLIVSGAGWWYPGTVHYAKFNSIPNFFLKAEHRKGFEKLSIVTGVNDSTTLKNRVAEVMERQQFPYSFVHNHGFGLEYILNIDKLNSKQH